MKKILMWLTVLALMLTGAAFADQENAPVMLVKLPEDAQMVENVAFDDGDFIQTYQLSGGAYVQLLRYAQGDVTLDGIVAGDWPGATDIQSMALETVGGCAAKRRMRTKPRMPISEKLTMISCICWAMNNPTSAMPMPAARFSHISARYTGPV